MQWLFERYWNAQRAALDAVREKATERVAELIAAEAAWRARLEREKGAVKANRGRAATAAKKKSHQKSKKSHRQNADDDDSSSSSDDDAVTAAGGLNPEDMKNLKARRKTAYNALVASVHDTDTMTVVNALSSLGGVVLSVGAGSTRGAEGGADDVDMTIEDWTAAAKRAVKRWPYLHEELLLMCVENALTLAANASASAAETDAAAAVAVASVDVFAANFDATLPEMREGAAEVIFGPGPVTGVGDLGVPSRQRALAWHLLRKTLATPDPTAATAAIGDALLNVVGAGRKFSAKAGAMLSGSAPKTKSGGGKKGDDATDATDDADDAANDAADEELREAARAAGVDAGGKKRRSKPPPITAGKWELCTDWTPCAWGEIPEHIKGKKWMRSELEEAAAAAAAAPEEKDVPEEERRRREEENARVVADLLWGAWPGDRGLGFKDYVGYGEAIPGVNYTLGGPFNDPSRRMIPGTEKEGYPSANEKITPDPGVIGPMELFTGVRPLKSEPKLGSGKTFTPRPGRGVGVGAGGGDAMRAAIAEGLRGGESLTFVDEDDSRDTDELDVDGGGGGGGGDGMEVDQMDARGGGDGDGDG